MNGPDGFLLISFQKIFFLNFSKSNSKNLIQCFQKTQQASKLPNLGINLMLVQSTKKVRRLTF